MVKEKKHYTVYSLSFYIIFVVILLLVKKHDKNLILTNVSVW